MSRVLPRSECGAASPGPEECLRVRHGDARCIRRGGAHGPPRTSGGLLEDAMGGLTLDPGLERHLFSLGWDLGEETSPEEGRPREPSRLEPALAHETASAVGDGFLSTLPKGHRLGVASPNNIDFLNVKRMLHGGFMAQGSCASPVVESVYESECHAI